MRHRASAEMRLMRAVLAYIVALCLRPSGYRRRTTAAADSVRWTGNEFVNTLATRLKQAWLAVCHTFESVRLDAAARSDAHDPRRWLMPTTMDSVGGIQVGDR
eukprot:6183228-Pleurochrysis_carterae.AAC.1